VSGAEQGFAILFMEAFVKLRSTGQPKAAVAVVCSDSKSARSGRSRLH